MLIRIGYGLLLNETLNMNLHIITTNNYKLLWDNLDNLIDYILIDKYKHIKLLLKAIQLIHIDNIIKLKYRFGYNVLNYILINNLQNIINICLQNIKLCQIMHKKLYITKQVEIIIKKYGYHKYVNKFISVLGENIIKITAYNVDHVFMMFILTKINKFNGFECWGLGNNKSIDINIQKHYEKHVNNKEENWKDYLPNKNIECYKNFAINKCKQMKNKMVHTNGTKVYLSGFYDNILIIGRLINNKLCISSMYMVYSHLLPHKLKAFNTNLCFMF